jgi:cyanophycin synthetase
MHHYPAEGPPRDVGGSIVDMLFPADDGGRIPLVSITGTNGKTTVARMLAWAVGKAGLTAGLTTTDGVYIGGRRIAKGDMTGPRSARAVLSDPAVDVAVLETARGGIVRAGLGYDWSDVGVLTNVQLDHIGQDGIETVDDLVHIKSLVAERVREGGTLVLNADDEHVAALAEHERIRRLPRTLVYFSLQPVGRRIDAHLAAGGTAYFPKNGWIVEARGTVYEPVCRIANVPATLGGAAQFNLSNALAAVAAGRALGVSTRVLAVALETFELERENPGRANLYAVGQGYVLLDYGHNPAAIAAIGRMTSRWQGRRLTGIVGLPGDRSDAVVQQASAAAASVFDRIIVREDRDLRGRRRREMAAIIEREIRRARPHPACRVIASEADALREALRTFEPGELAVIFYEDLDSVLEVLLAAGAVRVPGGLAALRPQAPAQASPHAGPPIERRASIRPHAHERAR